MIDPPQNFQNADDAPLAADQLLPLVYEELRSLAAAQLAREGAGHTLQPTALVHEAWLKLTRSDERIWDNRTHFYRAAAQAMRRILIDHARQKNSLKRDGGKQVDISLLSLEAASPDDRLLLIDESLKRLDAEDPESAEIVMLKFFAGLSNKETARALGLSEATIERRWAFAKARLFDIIRDAEDGGRNN